MSDISSILGASELERDPLQQDMKPMKSMQVNSISSDDLACDKLDDKLDDGHVVAWTGMSNADFPLPPQLASYITFRKMSHEEKLKQGYKSLENTKIRSIYWKYYFGIILPSDKKAHVSQVKQTSHYTSLRKQYNMLLENHIEALNRQLTDNELDPLISNPLSTDEMNPWQVIYNNQALEKTIRQDMDRLFPEIPFFANQIIISQREENPITTPLLDIMKRILFIWSKENENVSYRQGMHELLACIMYQIYRDIYLDNFDSYMDLYIEKRNVSDIPTGISTYENAVGLSDSDREVLEELKIHLDPEYIEHDCYAIFSRLMLKMKTFFEWGCTGKDERKKAEDFPLHVFCDKVQNQILKKSDPPLYNRLTSLNIEPQIYGLRWVRLLFGREFALDDVLNIWDAIFSHGFKGLRGHELHPEKMHHSIDDLSFVQYLSTVMLIYLREDLLKSQSTDCLKYLMKYPPVQNPHIFVQKTLRFMEKPTYIKLFQDGSNRKIDPFPYPPITEMAGLQNISSLAPKSKSSFTKDIGQLASGLVSHKSKVKTMTNADRDRKIVSILDEVVHILQQEVFRPTAEINNIDAVTLSIAELKRISHVLQGVANPQSLEDSLKWIKSYKEIGSNTSSDKSSTSTSTKKKPRPLGTL